jgi:MFS family permease
MTRVALPYQLYVLTHTPLSLGGLAAAQLAPFVAFSLFGGSVADAVDRRKLLLCTQSGLCLVSAALAVLAFTGWASAWAIYVLAFVAASLMAADRPARSSMMPRLVPADRLSSALALSHVSLNTARVLGPAAGGVVVGTLGVTAAYGIDALTFSAALAALLGIAAIPPLSQTARPGLKAMAEGLRYVGRTRVVLGAFAIDLNATILGMPVALFPVLALDVFHVGPQGLGLLAAAPALGAVLGLLFSGWARKARYQGRVVLAAVAIWGLTFTVFGLVPWFPVALLLLLVAGAADAISSMLRWTIIQLTTPDVLRGRVAALNSMVIYGGPRLGDIESTAVASITSAQFSVVSGGLACLLTAGLVARWAPGLVHYDAFETAAAHATTP